MGWACVGVQKWLEIKYAEIISKNGFQNGSRLHAFAESVAPRGSLCSDLAVEPLSASEGPWPYSNTQTYIIICCWYHNSCFIMVRNQWCFSFLWLHLEEYVPGRLGVGSHGHAGEVGQSGGEEALGEEAEGAVGREEEVREDRDAARREDLVVPQAVPPACRTME